MLLVLCNALYIKGEDIHVLQAGVIHGELAGVTAAFSQVEIFSARYPLIATICRIDQG